MTNYRRKITLSRVVIEEHSLKFIQRRMSQDKALKPGNDVAAKPSTFNGTIRPIPNFDPHQDSTVLRNAMKGLGTDEDSIINVLTKRSNGQRLAIASTFKQMYGEDLLEELQSELSGDFNDAIVALMTPPFDFLASEVRKAVEGSGTDEDALIEILCTAPNADIGKIKEAYTRLFQRNLEADVVDDTSGDFKRLLVSAINGYRSEDKADRDRARRSAKALFEAGVKHWGTDEEIFNSIILRESYDQLALTFEEYKKLAKQTIEEAIEGEMSGDLKQAMLAIVYCVRSKPFYFAHRLNKAMKGAGTDDTTLIRVLVSRSEIDLADIKVIYNTNYGESLEAAVEDDTSGDYQSTLLSIVRGNY